MTPLSFSETIQPVQLPEPNADIPFNRNAWVTGKLNRIKNDILIINFFFFLGWGLVNESLYEPSPILQKVSVTLLSNSYCQSQLKDDYLIGQNLCAGDWLNTKGHCSVNFPLSLSET